MTGRRPVLLRPVAVVLATGAAALALGIAETVVRPPAAVADGSTGGVVNVNVVSATGVALLPAQVLPADVVGAPQNQDVHETTTLNAVPFPNGHPAQTDSLPLEQPIGGASFAELARLSRIPLQLLVPGSDAVSVDTGDAGPPTIRNTMSLSATEVVDGFADPCTVAPGCVPDQPPDTTPQFASVETASTGPDDYFLVQRPPRPPPVPQPDENGNNVLQTCVDCDLDVTFALSATPLLVGPPTFVSAPSQSAITVAPGATVSFAPPSDVTFFGGTPDTGPLTYSWTFGDGQTATGASPSNTYAAEGAHPVFVTVKDALGNLGVSRQLTVNVPTPPPSGPAFVPNPPPAAKSPPPVSPPPPKVVPRPAVTPIPVSHAVVTRAPALPPATAVRLPAGPATHLKLSTDRGGTGSGSGTGTGSGNGNGAGTGAGAATGVAGGSGHSTQGVGVGGSPTGSSATSQAGSRASSLPEAKVNGLVGVLIDPSGGAVALSTAVGRTASQVAAAARALAGGGRDAAIDWPELVLGIALLAALIGGRALAEFEPRAAYRSLRRR